MAEQNDIEQARAIIAQAQQERLSAATTALKTIIDAWGVEFNARVTIKMESVEVAPGVWGQKPHLEAVLND